MISIITPVHAKAAPFLREAYDSLCQQSLTEWEWVTVTNAGGVVPEDIAADPRVKVFSIEDDDPQHNRIGRLKAAACALATGEILVELDADDLLLPNALAEIAQAFEDPGVAMAYSNSAEFRDGTWASSGYSDYFGWRSRPFFHAGHELREMIAWPPSPQMMRFIFWAPNHVRCWRTAAYKSVGGHDPAIKTGDDHDLCCRFFIQYGAAGLRHIDRCLYLYRLHGQNSCVVHNDEVQIQTLANYQKYSRDMAIRWAKDAGLQLLDLGGRLSAWPGFSSVDEADLSQSWPLADHSVGVLRASHIFEKLDPIHAMNEAFRVLAPGGWLLLEVSSTDGRGAFQNPTNKSFWNENSIWYYTKSAFSRFIPDFKGRFQNSRTVTFFPSDFERLHNMPVVQTDLLALKGDYATRPCGEVLI